MLYKFTSQQSAQKYQGKRYYSIKHHIINVTLYGLVFSHDLNYFFQLGLTTNYELLASNYCTIHSKCNKTSIRDLVSLLENSLFFCLQVSKHSKKLDHQEMR